MAHLIKSFGIGFAKFLRVYLVALVVGAVLTQIGSPFNFTPGYIARSISVPIGGAMGYSFGGTLLGLFVEPCATRKFEGRIFLYVSLPIMLILWACNRIHP